VALHALLGSAAAATALPWPVKAILAGLVVAHCRGLWPAAGPRVLVCRADGRFDLPDLRQAGLTLGAGSLFTTHWARLVLIGGGTTFGIVLARDQLDESSWRLLLAHLGDAAD